MNTFARPPRKNPLTPQELLKPYAVKRLDVGPFLAEFRTLAAQWASLLPFGLECEHIPPPATVRHYTLNVFKLNSEEKYRLGRVPVFVLVFWNNEALGGGSIWSLNLHKVLLPDEKGARDPVAVELRKKALCVVAVSKFDAIRDEVSFWMDENVVKKWRKEDWMVQLWRDDTYRPVSAPLPVTQVPQDSPIMPTKTVTSLPCNGLSEGDYWSD